MADEVVSQGGGAGAGSGGAGSGAGAGGSGGGAGGGADTSAMSDAEFLTRKSPTETTKESTAIVPAKKRQRQKRPAKKD